MLYFVLSEKWSWVISLTAKISTCGWLAGSVLVVSGVLGGSGWLAWSLRSSHASSHSSYSLAAKLFQWAYVLFDDSLKSSRQTIDMAGVWFITARIKYTVFLHGNHIKDQSGRRIPLWTLRLIMSRLGLAWSTQSPPRDLQRFWRNPRWLPADKQTVPTVRSRRRKIQITGNILSYNPLYNSWCHLSFFLPCRELHEPVA